MKFSYQKLPIHQSVDSRVPRISRPYLPIYLHNKIQSTPSPYFALLDSGADNVLMPAELAEVVGIQDIKGGKNSARIVGVGGQTVDIYFHELEIQVQGDNRRLPTIVGFAEKIEIPLLGRSFFQHFREVVFDEKRERIELKA